MIELRLLRYFVAVAETEHVGQAARKLHVSQSPLSRQIQQLEKLLGLELFERDRRRIRLTDTGRWLLEPARQLLARSEMLLHDARRLSSGDIGRLRVGFASAAIWTGILPRTLRELRARHPAIQIELRNLSSQNQLEALRASEIDLALVQRAPDEREFQVQRVHEQQYALAVQRSDPLSTRAVKPSHLNGRDFIAVLSGASERERWIATAARAGFTPNISVEVSDWASALALVDTGMGIALIPDSYRNTAPPGCTLRTLPWLRAKASLWLARRTDDHAPLNEEFTKLISQPSPPLPPKRKRSHARARSGR